MSFKPDYRKLYPVFYYINEGGETYAQNAFSLAEVYLGEVSPLITVCLLIRQSVPERIVARGIAIRSKRDEFDLAFSQTLSYRRALRAYANRPIDHVRRPSAIRTLIDCRCNFTAHGYRIPEVTLFELSFVKTRNKVVEIQQRKSSVQPKRPEGKVQLKIETNRALSRWYELMSRNAFEQTCQSIIGPNS